MLVCMFALQKQEPPPAPVKPVVKKENQWFDVGIVKVTNMVVTHFYVPTDDSHGDVSVSMASFFFFLTVALERAPLNCAL